MNKIPCKECLCAPTCKNKKFLDLINQCELLPAFILSHEGVPVVKISATEANNGYMYLSCGDESVSKCLNNIKKVLRSPMFETDAGGKKRELSMKMIFLTIRERLFK